MARIYLDSDMEVPTFSEFGGWHAAVFSARCPGSSTANEDAAALIPFDETSCVAVVADGLGGGSAGDRASALAIAELRQALEHAAAHQVLLRTAILTGIESANAAIRELGIGAMTTLAVVELGAAEMRTYHVGDSTILVIGGRGRVRLRTIPHSPVGYGVESGLLDSAEAMHHADRHLVSNVIGDAEMRIEIGPLVPLRALDTIVLGSDGLFDNLHEDEIAQALCHGPFRQAVRGLCGAARQRMLQPSADQPSKHDDLTMIALRGTKSRTSV